MKKATFIPVNGEPKVVELSNDYEVSSRQINELVGGWFDCVRVDQLGIVIYVHDEGLLMNMEANVVASTLANQLLVGDVLICGSLNSDGFYDGETYDVPEMFTDETFIVRAQIANTIEVLIENLNNLREEVIEASGRVFVMGEQAYNRTISKSVGDPMFN
jgi:hypothetical protein